MYEFYLKKNNKMKRIYIYPKDVERISGKSNRQCRRILAIIRYKNNKQKNHPVTIFEFCEYTKLKIEEVQQFLI